MKTNSLDAVMIRGRWREATTARIYLDDARATLVKLAVPTCSRPLLRRFRHRLLVLLSRCASGQQDLGG